jgi:galactokinase
VGFPPALARAAILTVIVPGRANLIGEHIDYHGLPVLPIALRRAIRVEFEPRDDDQIAASSSEYGRRSFRWTPHLTPVAAGDWENYLRAAAEAVAGKWGAGRGIDAAIESDLPPACRLPRRS